MDPWIAVVFIALIGYVAFQQWLRQNRRVLIHRERLAAIEKGIELPPIEEEVHRSTVNVQRLLLLAGFIWMSIGIATLAVLTAIVFYPTPQTTDIPYGIQFVGLAPLGIGISHLLVFVMGKHRGW